MTLRLRLSDVPVIRQRLQVALGALGVTIRNQAAADAATTVRVTLSQTARQGLWVVDAPTWRIAVLVPRNRLVQIHNGPRDHGHCGQIVRPQVFRHG